MTQIIYVPSRPFDDTEALAQQRFLIARSWLLENACVVLGTCDVCLISHYI